MSLKEPVRILGYIKYDDGDEYPFELLSEENKVVLYPPTIKKWRVSANPFNFFKNFKKEVRREWIGNIKFEGITSENYRIIINVKDLPSNYHGFLSYQVNWYYYCIDTFKIDQIAGLRISGREVDFYYPPQVALTSEVIYSDDYHNIEKMQVSTQKDDNLRNCGKYQLKNGLEIDIEVVALASFRYNVAFNPIDASSFMTFKFSSSIELEDLITLYYHIYSFFKYIVYRKNIFFDSIDTYYIAENGLRDYAGKLVFPKMKNEEDDENANKMIIGYDVIEDKTSDLFKTICNGEMGLSHLCESIEGRKHYIPGRMIMVLSEFEREFRNIYGIDYGRSDCYKSTKEEIINLIENYCLEHSGDVKKYAQSIKRSISHMDNSYAQNVEKALLDCEEIMEPFIKFNYGQEFKDVIKEISNRVGEIRNGIAHSKLDFELDAIHLSDLKIIEELTYAIRLNKIGISKEKIKNGLKSLFAENI